MAIKPKESKGSTSNSTKIIKISIKPKLTFKF